MSGEQGSSSPKSTSRYSGNLTESAKERLGARVRALAERQGFNQSRLVAATGLGKGTIEDLWKGRANPTLSTLLAVASELRVGSIEELLGTTATQVAIADQRVTTGDDDS